MISSQAIERGYNHGDYTVGAPSAPLWKVDGLDRPVAGAPRYADGDAVEVPADVRAELTEIADEVLSGSDEVAEHTRDWWPGTMLAHTEGAPASPDALLVSVSDVAQVQAVVRVAAAHGIPLTVSAGRSNVTGSALPLRGGIVLDVTRMNRILGFDETDLTVSTEPGVFGDVFEAHLQHEWNVTTGHWPSSFAISTVGGWVACRGAGQLSTRYGKVEDMVTELDVVLPDGELVTIGGTQRAAVGPDLKQLFLGSEGRLGVITRIVFRTHRLPQYEAHAAFSFADFHAGLAACRAIMQAGATPAVLRLYDAPEAQHHFGIEGRSVLLIADEGDRRLVDAMIEVAIAEAAPFGERLDADPIMERWLDTRYVTGRGTIIDADKGQGFVADTLEMVGGWSQLDAVYDGILAAVAAVPGTIGVSAHQSHAYTDSACLYFTLQGVLPLEERAAWYRAVWDAANAVIVAEGAQLSHHHGIGLLRAPYMRDSLGKGLDLLAQVARAIDPKGIMNPGKLGLS